MTDSSPVPGAASAPTGDSAAPPATASATITPSPLSTLLSTTHARSANRCCFLLHVRTDRLTEYVEVHQHVWEEMSQALTRCGRRNYSLFLRPEDGLVVGYFESNDAAAASQRGSTDGGLDGRATWACGQALEFFGNHDFSGASDRTKTNLGVFVGNHAAEITGMATAENPDIQFDYKTANDSAHDHIVANAANEQSDRENVADRAKGRAQAGAFFAALGAVPHPAAAVGSAAGSIGLSLTEVTPSTTVTALKPDSTAYNASIVEVAVQHGLVDETYFPDAEHPQSWYDPEDKTITIADEAQRSEFQQWWAAYSEDIGLSENLTTVSQDAVRTQDTDLPEDWPNRQSQHDR